MQSAIRIRGRKDATIGFMQFLHALLLGAIDGLTEFLPISSTAHVLLAEKAMGIASTDFTKTFTVAIQLGAILAIAILYAKRLIQTPSVLLRVGIAFLPMAVIGFLLHGVVKSVFFDNMPLMLVALGVGGVFLIIFDRWHREGPQALKDLESLPIGHTIIIGFFQAAAIIPGVSRSAATIIGGLLVGMSRRAIVEFSFLLAIPTMTAATGYDLLKTGADFTRQEWLLLGAGFAAAFVTAILSVRWFLRYIGGHSFLPFGIERIVVAIAAWVWLA